MARYCWPAREAAGLAGVCRHEFADQYVRDCLRLLCSAIFDTYGKAHIRSIIAYSIGHTRLFPPSKIYPLLIKQKSSFSNLGTDIDIAARLSANHDPPCQQSATSLI
ncbi:hypothetical protein N7G274_003343 [Stereocaulon virgatum]|uniref:Uncharacterized protein n=1 Tax=Stereocaulon virgatum TaxID=373712 RepID=A0ABR4AK73_9LECA